MLQNNYKKWLALTSMFCLFFTPLFSQENGSAPKPSTLSNPLALTMLIIAIALVLIIAILSNVLLGIANWFRNNQKNITAIIILALLSTPLYTLAQEAAPPTIVDNSIGGMDAFTFYILAGVIGVEILVIAMQLYFIKIFFAKEKVAVQTVETKENFWLNLWEKANSFKSAEKETEIDLGHNYDGIRELDNSLPKWWLYGFYITVFAGIVYLYRFHYTHSGKSSKEEYDIAMQIANEEKEIYLAKAANNVNENTVAFISDAGALEKGKTSFTAVCAACHGVQGQGGVGPNLTDEFWLHGGSIKDIFKIIKYGYPEKGMRSWNDDFSPVQIAQIASYVKSLQGTNPANAKEKQGDIFVEEKNMDNTDSTAKKSITMK
jgi:cytochrome c oxidase cbb3-type subunit III